MISKRASQNSQNNKRSSVLFALAIGLFASLFYLGWVFIANDYSLSDIPATNISFYSEQDEVEQRRLSEGYRARQAAFESINPSYPDEEKIVYTIGNDGTPEPSFDPADAQLWLLLEELAPEPALFSAVKEFEVYYDEADDTLAAVQSITETNDTWLFSINYVAVTDFEELIPTILHEYAHILSLEDSQTTTEIEQAGIRGACMQYLVEEGCLTSRSYLHEFYTSFWEDNEDLQEEDRTLEEGEELYDRKTDDYVTAYATTNPAEDFAESFMFFALKNEQKAGTLRKEKVDFFTQFSNLAGYRDSVRARITSWATP